ncbi:hypothetical protein FQN57_004310 [Myotisia sp. PD_48]|nr:hypothetical protein FQN57_004310 [Myotisia sp. PD_48]
MTSIETILAFDLYGTLLSTESIAQQLGELFDREKGNSIALLWRRYQLEYTWRLNSMGEYDSFYNVTRNSLRHALAEHKLSLNDTDIANLMEEYDSLSSFPDVAPALTRLSKLPNLRPVIFSNGTEKMITKSAQSSNRLEAYTQVFSDIISVEKTEKFKPNPETYRYLAERMGKDSKCQMREMWLISGNPFDVLGAMNVGMKAAWVDRAGLGWIDSMFPGTSPTVVCRDLIEVIDIIEKSTN